MGTVEAIAIWLEASRGVRPFDAPLFTALDFHNSGHRLTGDGIRKIVVRLCAKAGIKKVVSPHRIRHSAITAALDATDGNVRKVQNFYQISPNFKTKPGSSGSPLTVSGLSSCSTGTPGR
jgi:integrase/recombinase XerC